MRDLLKKRKGGILNYGLGDWLDVGRYELHPANTPIPVTVTAILYQDLCVLAQTFGVLGRVWEQKTYEALAEEWFYTSLAGDSGGRREGRGKHLHRSLLCKAGRLGGLQHAHAVRHLPCGMEAGG